jgi:protocatechuate 3,4-dioxygenase beta subunit
MSLATRVFSALLFSALCASIAQAQSGTPQQTGSNVEGKVVQEPGGAPIRKVVVRLQSTKDNVEQYTSAAVESGMDEDSVIALANRFGEDQNTANQPFTTSTDSTGHFRIESVPPGQYLVSILRDGYVPLKMKQTERFITVAAAQDLSGLVYRMESAGFITGKIVDADGDPVAGVAVQAMPKGKPQAGNDSMVTAFAFLGGLGAVPGLGTTNDLGEFRISGLRPGQYIVVARPTENLGPAPSASDKGHPRESVLYAPTYYPGALDQKQASPLQVLPGSAASANFTLLTSRAYRVSGTIAGVNQGGTIMLISGNGRPPQQSLREGGKFDFPSLPPGTYTVQIFEQPGEGSTGEPKMLRLPNPIVVTGSDLTDLVLQPLADGGTVSGRLRVDGQDTVDWKQMYVNLLPVADSTQEAGETSVMAVFLQAGASGALREDGSFELKNVAAGNYQLAVGATNTEYRDWYMKSLLLGGREVADPGFAVSGDTTLDVIVSAKGPSIEGTVVDTDGKLVPEALVQTIPSSGKLGRPDSYQQGRTDVNGHFTLRGLNPGEFVVVALESQHGDARSADFFEKFGARGAKVELAEGEKKSITVTVIPDEAKE